MLPICFISLVESYFYNHCWNSFSLLETLCFRCGRSWSWSLRWLLSFWFRLRLGMGFYLHCFIDSGNFWRLLPGRSSILCGCWVLHCFSSKSLFFMPRFFSFWVLFYFCSNWCPIHQFGLNLRFSHPFCHFSNSSHSDPKMWLDLHETFQAGSSERQSHYPWPSSTTDTSWALVFIYHSLLSASQFQIYLQRPRWYFQFSSDWYWKFWKSRRLRSSFVLFSVCYSMR